MHPLDPLTRCGRMYKKIRVLELYEDVQIALTKAQKQLADY